MPHPRIEEDLDMHFKIMSILEVNPIITQRELARNLGVSVGSMNHCLHALMDQGLVCFEDVLPGVSRHGYVLTDVGVQRKSELAVEFLRRRMREREALNVEIDRLSRGLGWC